VSSLHRSRYAMLTDEDMEPGQHRALADREIEALRSITKEGSG